MKLVPAIRTDALAWVEGLPEGVHPPVEVAVEFPDAWCLVRRWDDFLQGRPAYLARRGNPTPSRWPRAAPQVGRDRTPLHRFYCIFAPEPLSVVAAVVHGGPALSLDIVSVEQITVYLFRAATLQTWSDEAGEALVWEGFMNSLGRRAPHWRSVLAEAWESVIAETGARRVWTPGREPAWPGGDIDYQQFLADLGFQPADPRWWVRTGEAP